MGCSSRVSPLTLLVALLSIFIFDTAATSTSGSSQTLAAAFRKSLFRRRNSVLELRNDAELVYAAGANSAGSDNYIATVRVASDKPILVVEDNEHLLSDIDCTAYTITLSKAASAQSWEWGSLAHVNNGHIITSHHGCNAETERKAYRIVDLLHAHDSSVSFSVVPASWKTSFSSVEVEFGSTDAGHGLRSHDVVRRTLNARQAVPATSLLATLPTGAAPQPPSPQSSSSSDSSYSFNLGDIPPLINKSINPLKISTPGELTCVNCTFWGSIDLDFAKFGFTTDTDDYITGVANATINGVGAHLEVGANLSQTWDFYVPLAKQTSKYSITVPGVGSTSLLYGPYLYGGYAMNGSVGVTTGLDLSIPSGAQITINVGNWTSSSVTGFAGSSITPIQPQSSAEITDLATWLSLRTVVSASFSFDAAEEVSGSAAAGAYLDLPILWANFTALQDVDENCNQINASSSKQAHQVESILTSPLRIDYAAGYDYGAFLDLDLQSDELNIHSDHDSMGGQLASVTLPMQQPTKCLNFNNHTSGYESAQQAVSTSKSSGGGSGSGGSGSGSKNSAAGHVQVRVWMAGGAVLALSVYFVSL